MDSLAVATSPRVSRRSSHELPRPRISRCNKSQATPFRGLRCPYVLFLPNFYDKRFKDRASKVNFLLSNVTLVTLENSVGGIINTRRSMAPDRTQQRDVEKYKIGESLKI